MSLTIVERKSDWRLLSWTSSSNRWVQLESVLKENRRLRIIVWNMYYMYVLTDLLWVSSAWSLLCSREWSPQHEEESAPNESGSRLTGPGHHSSLLQLCGPLGRREPNWAWLHTHFLAWEKPTTWYGADSTRLRTDHLTRGARSTLDRTIQNELGDLDKRKISQ